MQRYFFDVLNGPATHTDTEGLDCSSLAVAENHAAALIGEILTQEFSQDHARAMKVAIRSGGAIVSAVALDLRTSRSPTMS